MTQDAPWRALVRAKEAEALAPATTPEAPPRKMLPEYYFGPPQRLKEAVKHGFLMAVEALSFPTFDEEHGGLRSRTGRWLLDRASKETIATAKASKV